MACDIATNKRSSTSTWLSMVATVFLAACGAEHNAHQASLALQGDAHSAAALTAGECDLDGTWAIRINVPVKWNGNTGLMGGSGELQQFVKAKRTRNGDTIHESLTVCGVTLPDYRSRMFQKFATRFPDELFDNAYLNTIEVDSHFEGFAPGATFVTDPVVSEMGVAMPNPLTDPWPARGPDLHYAVDGDQDGHPGVTLYAATGNGYSLPPTTLPNWNQAAKFYTAVRNIANISGTQTTCDLAIGQAEIPNINGKLALNSHVLGCELDAGGHCSAAQTKMLDDNQPGYIIPDRRPGPGKQLGTVVMMRIDESATCKDIREYDYTTP